MSQRERVKEWERDTTPESGLTQVMFIREWNRTLGGFSG